MSDISSPDHRSVVIAAIIMAVIGWLGIYLIMEFTEPMVGPRWLFFFSWTLAFTGTSLPFVWLLHRRFSVDQPFPTSTLLRQGLWVGFFASICVWLRFNRSLTLAVALFLAIGLATLEWFLRLMDRSSWRPKS